MITAPGCRVTSSLTVCAASIVAAGSLETTAGRAAAPATRIAAQGFRDDAIETLKPASLSRDGRLIAFVARSQSRTGVHVLDRTTGVITPESIRSDGIPSDGDSRAPSLSADGRVIAFETFARDLTARDPRFRPGHVVIRDRQTGTVRTPYGTRGQQADGESWQPVVSGDGNAVAFRSDATDLVPQPDAGDGRSEIYLWRVDESIVVVSGDRHFPRSSRGSSHSPSVDHDGGKVAFVSTARLAPGDTNDRMDVYLRDLSRRQTVLVSRGRDGTSSAGGSHSPALSADGRYVAFVSDAALARGDGNGESDVYIYDTTRESIELVSTTSAGVSANAASRRPSISADGQLVVYQSLASNLGSRTGCPRTVSDWNLLPDVYAFDRVSGCVTRISGSLGQEWWTASVAPAINGAGTLIVFSSAQWVDETDLSTDFDLFLSLLTR